MKLLLFFIFFMQFINLWANENSNAILASCYKKNSIENKGIFGPKKSNINKFEFFMNKIGIHTYLYLKKDGVFPRDEDGKYIPYGAVYCPKRIFSLKIECMILRPHLSCGQFGGELFSFEYLPAGNDGVSTSVYTNIFKINPSRDFSYVINPSEEKAKKLGSQTVEDINLELANFNNNNLLIPNFFYLSQKTCIRGENGENNKIEGKRSFIKLSDFAPEDLECHLRKSWYND